jgi:sulfonate transport system substrate-binding protein
MIAVLLDRHPLTPSTRFSRKISWIAGVAVAATLGSASLGSSRAENAALKGVTLTIGIQSSGSSIATALIEASGAFADASYKIEWANFDGANAAVEALHAGAIDLDVGLNFSAPVLNQANAAKPWTADDRPYVIIGANLQLHRAGTAIVVHRGSGINSVSDLSGKSISFAKGTANHYFLAIAAQKAGLSLDAVTPVLMPLAEARAAFVGKSVDALVTASYNARPLVTSGDGRILTTSEGLYDTYAWFVARPDVLKDPARRAATADVFARLQRASAWQSDNPDKVAQVFIKEAHQKPQDAALNAAEIRSIYVPIDDKVIAANQSQADVFFSAGVAKTKIDASIAFDKRFNEVVAGPAGKSN